MDKPEALYLKEKAQRKAKWKRRFYVALVTTLIVANLYAVVDITRSVEESRRRNTETYSQLKELNAQYAKLNERRSELNEAYEKEIQQLDQLIKRHRD